MNPITLLVTVVLGAIGALLVMAQMPQAGAVFFILAALTLFSLKMANNWERFVILRAGKLSSVKGPGLFMIIPVIDAIAAVIDERIQTTQFNAEQALTRDTVPVNVDAVIFWHVHDAQRAALNITDYRQAIDRVAQTSLREMIGASHLSALLAERKAADEVLRAEIAGKTADWGISVNSVEIRDVAIPVGLAGRHVAPGAGRAREGSARDPRVRRGGDCAKVRRRGADLCRRAGRAASARDEHHLRDHQGARRHHPDPDLDGGFHERRAAGGDAGAEGPGREKLKLARYPTFTAASARAFFAGSKPCMPPNHWMATTAPLTGCSRPSVIASAIDGHNVMLTQCRRDFGLHH